MYTEDAWPGSMPVRACVRMPAAPNSSDINDTVLYVGTRFLCYSTVFEKWETCVADTACPGICAPMSSLAPHLCSELIQWRPG